MIKTHDTHSVNYWENLARNRYLVPDDAPVYRLTEELLGYLHSTDPILRDDIAYRTLSNWIIAGQYSDDELRQMMTKWRNDLQSGLGEINMPGVVTRSFAALMLSIIAYRHWEQPFLTQDEVKTLLSDALAYLKDEADLRGYDPRFGWIHATAHTANLLKFLVRDVSLDNRDLWQVMREIANKVALPQEKVFTHSEEERLAWVVIEVMKRAELPSDAFYMWIDRLADVCLQEAENDTGRYTNPGQHGAYQNTKHLLRAVYMRLTYSSDLPGKAEVEPYLHQKLKLFLK